LSKLNNILAESSQEGLAVGRTFALFKNYQIDDNKEMIAIGMMNVVGSCTSCYVSTGLFLFPSILSVADPISAQNQFLFHLLKSTDSACIDASHSWEEYLLMARR